MAQELIPEIEIEIPLSCRALALQVMNDPQLSPLLYNTTGWTLAASSSAFAIGSTATSTIEGVSVTGLAILRESLPKARLLITGWSYPASYYSNRMDMERGTPLATVPRFCLEANTLVARASTSISDATAANLKAHFVPVVGATSPSTNTTLPDQLLPHLVELIATRMMGNIGGDKPNG